MKRVVVTGMGLVTPSGVGVPAAWERIATGVSGISALKGEEYAKIPCRVAATVSESVENGKKNKASFYKC